MKPETEVLRYAFLLDWGTRIGLVALILSFGAYVFGIVTPHVPLEQLPAVWNLPVATYLQQTNTPTGWGWWALVLKGDVSNLIGISILAGCSVPPLLALIPLYIKKRDYIFATICGLIVLVLLLAASGILTAGH